MPTPTPNPIAGTKFGRLKIIDGVIHRLKRDLYFDVVCDCGNQKRLSKANLLSGRSKSCGCLNSELAKERFTQHGMRSMPIYAVWNMMKQRCYLNTNKQYKDYGGRGIEVCERWHTFTNFYSDVGEPPFKGATLERIDNNKNYEPSNTRWATHQEQQKNTRKTVIYAFRGESLTLSEIAAKVGMNCNTLRHRVYGYGMPVEVAVTDVAPAKAGYKLTGKRVDGERLYKS